STHIDKGHVHNHISINAISLDGKKLEDRLSNTKEGLYALSNTSDKIAAEYGCFIMPKKIYHKDKKKDLYFQYKEQTFKEKIQEDIESVIYKCNTLDEFLDELSIMGYRIKRGKHIAVKGIGMERYARLSTIDVKYSTNKLYEFFKSKNNIKLLEIKGVPNLVNEGIIEKANESKIAIEKSQFATKGKVYSEYQKTKYQELRRYYELKKQLEYLEKYNITSFNDLDFEIELKRAEIKDKNLLLKKDEQKYNKVLEINEKAQDYIRLYEIYEYAMSYSEIDPKYKLPTEVEIFLKLQNELKITSVDEAKQLIKSTREERIHINQKRSEVLELQRELNHLDFIKEQKLINSKMYIHNIKFGGNHIDYKLSTDDKYCINLPYTNEKIYIPKKCTAFNEKYQYYTLFLVDDKEYEIYNENNEKIGNITGTELEKYVLEKKNEIDKMYRNF
ncbi:MAG: relaxase/mobilization nuclease domain-containing protein, partial [Clostridia bacterium]|nr:relaxase/mobilization nuclease domain-containing protein [Clostridia bacterium]